MESQLGSPFMPLLGRKMQDSGHFIVLQQLVQLASEANKSQYISMRNRIDKSNRVLISAN